MHKLNFWKAKVQLHIYTSFSVCLYRCVMAVTFVGFTFQETQANPAFTLPSLSTCQQHTNTSRQTVHHLGCETTLQIDIYGISSLAVVCHLLLMMWQRRHNADDCPSKRERFIVGSFLLPRLLCLYICSFGAGTDTEHLGLFPVCHSFGICSSESRMYSCSSRCCGY